jgi:hypothetical protein
MSVDISVSITEDIVDIIATPTVNIVNVTNSASIDPSLYDLSEFTNTSPNPFVRTSGLSSYVPTSRTLTINGVTQDLSADRTFTIATGLTIGTTPISSGTIGRVLFQGTGNVLQQSSSLAYDDTAKLFSVSANQNATTKITISNTTSGTASTSELGLTSDSSAGYFNVGKLSTTISTYKIFAPKDGVFYNAIGGDISILNDAANGKIKFSAGQSATAQVTIASTGNVLINTTTDAGFRLDVNGTARVSGLTTLSGTMTASGAIARNQLINGTLVAAANSDTLVGLDIAPTFTNGSFTSVQNIPLRINASDTQAGALGLLNIIGSDNFAQVITMQPLISSYTGHKTIGFKAIGTSGQAMGIGCNFTTGTPTYLSLFNSTGIRFVLFNSTGNIGINTTTDAGFRLDVNGTARINTLTIGLGTGQVSTNTVLGLTALNANTTGNQTTAIGNQSLNRNTTGNANVAIGSQSMLFNLTGELNTAIGTNSLLNNTTGSNNTAVGLGTVSGNFSGSVILGMSATATANNQFVVGSSTVNAGSVTTEVNVSTQVWNVVINGVARKILLA